ncbi:MAG: TIR domain-containing protein [Anaerolineae bacterium]|jgi:WD40 repeat protein|nr:TIR domain-containing protein [Anaerolineae bacterium]
MSFSDVFVSYRRKDVEFAKKLHQALRERQREVWIDWEDIPPGSENFSDDIRQGIENSHAFIAILSPNYLDSPYCLEELHHAAKNNKKLIPIVYEKFEGREFPPEIAPINWIYFVEHAGHHNPFEEAFQKVIAALDSDYDHTYTHTRLLQRAREWEEKARNQSFLLDGAELTEAEAWLTQAADKEPKPLNLHTEYILNSRTIQAKQQRRLLAYVSVALVVMILLVIVSVGLLILAIQREREAQSFGLAASARDQDQNDQILAVSLAVQANTITQPSLETQKTLADIAYAPGVEVEISLDASPVNTIALNFDDTRVAIGYESGQVFIMDVEGNQVRQTLEIPDNSAIRSVDFSPNDQRLISGGDNGQILLWDTESGTILTTINAHQGPITRVIFDARGERVFSTGMDAQAILWDLETGESVYRYQDVDGAPITAGAVSPIDPTLALLGFGNSLLKLWNMQTDEILTYSGHFQQINDVDFSPDGRCIYSASNDRVIISTEIALEDERYCGRQQFIGHRDFVNDMVLSVDGSRLISVSTDRRVILWRKPPRTDQWGLYEQERVLTGHSYEIRAVALTQDGTTLFSGSERGSILRWQLINGALTSRQTFPHQVWAMDIYPDEARLIADENGTLRRYPRHSTEPDLTFAEGRFLAALDVSPDGRYAVTGEFGGGLTLWDAQTGVVIAVLVAGDPFAQTAVWDVKFNATSDQIVAGLPDQRVVIWDVSTASEIAAYQHSTDIFSVAFSPTGEAVLFGDGLGAIHLWDRSAQPPQTYLQHSDWVTGLAWSADGRYFASGSLDTRVILWDRQEDDFTIFADYNANVREILFDPSGNYLIAGLEDGTIGLWDVAQRQPIRSYVEHRQIISGLAFDPLTGEIISSDSDGLLLSWRIDTLQGLLEWISQHRYTRALTCNEGISFNVNVACED